MRLFKYEKKYFSSQFLFGLALGIFLVSVGFGAIWLFPSKGSDLNLKFKSVFKEPVSVAEIYPKFLCPCCGKPLDPNNICCGAAKEMIDYIDKLAADGLSKDEIILAFAKKYGFNSFADKNMAEEFRTKLAQTAPAERPIIFLTPASFDFGNVSQKGGVATTLFELKNEGKKDLIINKLDSSCGCTSASIIFEGKEGPRFAMAGHGIESPQNWSISIPPGKNGQLKVYYDPNVHPDFRGFAIREISVFSNDPVDFEKKVRIELNQID